MGVNADTVARYKYVSRGGKVDGFYSGNTFANQLGISTQVPNKVEIVSNNMAAKVVLVTDHGTICSINKKSLLDNQKKVKKAEAEIEE